MTDRKRWAGPSHLDNRPETYGDGLELGPATQALREMIRRISEIVPLSYASPREEVLDALERLAAIERALLAERALLLAEANYLGATWKQMASACKVTKQALHKRYAEPVGRIIAICTDPHPEKPLRLIRELHPRRLNHLLKLGLIIPEPKRGGERWQPGFRRHVPATQLAGQQAVEELSKGIKGTIPGPRRTNRRTR